MSKRHRHFEHSKHGEASVKVSLASSSNPSQEGENVIFFGNVKREHCEKDITITTVTHITICNEKR